MSSDGNREAFEQCGVKVNKSLDDFIASEPTMVSDYPLQAFVNRPCGESLVEFKVVGGVSSEVGEVHGLIVTDSLQNSPFGSSVWTSLPFGWIGLRVANFFKYGIVKDRSGFKDAMARVLSNPKLGLITFAHGPAIVGAKGVQCALAASQKYLGSCPHL